jgi:hypothetical protein
MSLLLFRSDSEERSDSNKTLLDKWLHRADNYDLPLERIPVKLRAGESGASYGWPKYMMGNTTLTKLHNQQVTTTSQCIQLAGCMTQKQFEKMFGERPSWGYLTRLMESQGNIQDYLSRKSVWDADQCIINTRILKELLPHVNRSDVVSIGGHSVRQLDVIKTAIAENEARLKRC